MGRHKVVSDEVVFSSVCQHLRGFGVEFSVDRMAKEAGLAGGHTLYHRFETKADLVKLTFLASWLTASERLELHRSSTLLHLEDTITTIVDVLVQWRQRDIGDKCLPYI